MGQNSLIQKSKKKGIPVFLTRALVFVMILILLDFTIGSILNYFYFRQKSGSLYRTTYSMDSTHAELLILGSSTTNHHYIPDIFEKKLGMSVYNSGRDGNSIFFNFAIFKSVITRYRPKAVILGFNVTEFKFREENYDRISSLLPYYSEHPEIRPIISLKGPFERLKLKSKIYPFNSLLLTVAAGNLDFNKERLTNKDDKGYIPLYHVWNRKISELEPMPEYDLDTNTVKLFKYLLQECRNLNIQIYIVVSPRFLKYNREDPSIQKAAEIAKNFNVPLFDYSKDTLFWNHPEYFANIPHLNNSGAKIFSNLVADKISDLEKSANDKRKIKLSINTKTNPSKEDITRY